MGLLVINLGAQGPTNWGGVFFVDQRGALGYKFKVLQFGVVFFLLTKDRALG